ncbi:protein translocase subunit SecF [Corynebacterium glyciniphilum]|uniref:protein translocase subunit SecF n=1 Tax=Corynebacterium glyciniphilum TaxID=1404244 RepID=UPI002650EFCD|nr:protein translocase subunit SecF [Corynebacterium glyciniphilum]MDN5683491.1 protein translocase subunit SecF [Corynebacterium glyciniphilum]MDN6704708.1 protein translocase subunit SecF [Corynebacterium glyciniphilum]
MNATTESKPAGFFEKMYNGESNFAFVAKRRRWYWIYALLTLLCFLVIALKGFTLGIDLEGGTRLTIPPADGATETSVTQVIEDATGVTPQSVQTVGTGNSQNIEVASERLSDDQIREARVALYDEFQPADQTGNPSPDAISDSTVSESWGQSVTQRMVIGMVVFLAVVFVYITIRMERDMAISAIVTLLLDGIFVAGIYSLIGFEVSPATIIGLLTILAYSLYDTVIVFDKVHENTQDVLSSTRSTYGEQVNLAVNQTVMRSLNTSLFSVVPIASLLVVAVWLMGVGTLKDLALVQFVGVIAGTFSSIYFSAPLLVTLKSRQKKMVEHDRKVARARELATDRGNVPAAAGESQAPVEDGTAESGNDTDAAQRRTVTLPPRTRGSDSQDSGVNGEDRGRTWRPGM